MNISSDEGRCHDESFQFDRQLMANQLLQETHFLLAAAHGNPIGSLNAEQLEANIWAASTPLEEEVWVRFHSEFGGYRY